MNLKTGTRCNPFFWSILFLITVWIYNVVRNLNVAANLSPGVKLDSIFVPYFVTRVPTMAKMV